MPVQAPVTNHGSFYVFEYFDELRFYLGDQHCQCRLPAQRRMAFPRRHLGLQRGPQSHADGQLIGSTKAT